MIKSSGSTIEVHQTGLKTNTIDKAASEKVTNTKKRRQQIKQTDPTTKTVAGNENGRSHEVPCKQSRLVDNLTQNENPFRKTSALLHQIEQIIEAPTSTDTSLNEANEMLSEPEPNKSVSDISNVVMPTASEIPNDLLESLEIPQNENSSGCLSPTAAFLMSFPVVASSTNRPNETDQLHQLSPSASEMLDLDGKHGINTNDQQLLDNISSLLSAAPLTNKSNPKSVDIINGFSYTATGSHELATTKSSGEAARDGLTTKPFAKDSRLSTAKDNSNQNILLNLHPSISAPAIEKPKEFFEPFQTFDEILESLKSSPSKPVLKAAKAPDITGVFSNKECDIPNFSFSSNLRPQAELKKRVTTMSTESSALYSKPYGFYETLSSIKPVAAVSKPSNSIATTPFTPAVSHASSNYSIPKLVNANNDVSGFSSPEYKYNLPETTNTGTNRIQSAETGLGKATNITNQSNQLNQFNINAIGSLGDSKTTSSSFAFPPPIISFSSENTFNPYTFDPLASSKVATSIPSNFTQPLPSFRNIPFTQLHQNQIQSTAATTPSSVPLITTSSRNLPVSSVAKATTVPSSLPNFTFDAPYSKSSGGSKDCKMPSNSHLPINQKNMDHVKNSNKTKSATSSVNSSNSSTQKSHVNWMTSVDNQKKPSADHLTLNFTPSANTFTQNTYTAMPQTPLSFLEDNVPWSPNRLLDSSHFTSVPVLPTLHGDLALNTISGDGPHLSSVPNFNLNAKHSASASSLQTPTKIQQSGSGYYSHKATPDRSNQVNSLPIDHNSSNVTGQSQSNFFSVSQLVDDKRDHKRNKQASRRLSYTQKPASMSGHDQRISRQMNNSHRFTAPHAVQSQISGQSSNPPQFHSQPPPLASTPFNDSYSIPMLTAESAKPPNQQPSNNYSAEALISHQSSANAKRKPSFVASSSLSQEFYNPSESLMEFSTSNDIFNPYFTHNNLSSSDSTYTNFMPAYSDLNLSHPPIMQDSQTNYESQTISMPQNQGIQGIHSVSHGFSPVTANSTTNYHTPQFTTNLKDSDKDSKKQGITNYSISNLTFESTPSNIFTAPLALGSPLLAVPPSSTLMFPPNRPVSEVSSSSSAYHLPNFLPNTGNSYPSYGRSTGNDNLHLTAGIQKPTSQNQFNSQANSNYHPSYARSQSVVSSSQALNNSIGNNSNTLTNFNLSTICPEINKDKNWST